MKKINKHFVIKVDEKNPEKREITVIGSSLEIDRDRDLVDIKSMNLENFKANPVVLWSHRSGEPPIAKAISVMKTNNNSQLKFKLQFATKEDYPFADTIYRLTKSGYINATSIGFSVDHTKSEYDKDRGGSNYNNSDLLEISMCNVPANAGALVTQRSFQKALDDKVINQDELDEYLSKTENDKEDVTPEITANTEDNSEHTINELLEQMQAITLSLENLKKEVKSLKEKNENLSTNESEGSLYDSLFDDLVEELDLGSESSSEPDLSLDDSDLDELINQITTNEEQ